MASNKPFSGVLYLFNIFQMYSFDIVKGSSLMIDYKITFNARCYSRLRFCGIQYLFYKHPVYEFDTV